MLTSVNQLLKGTLRHWYQLAGGTLVSVVGLVASANEWAIPGSAWGTMAYLLFLWAVASAYHDLRVQCDAAVADLSDMTDHQRLADLLTERCGYAKRTLLIPRNHQFASEGFQANASQWFESVREILEAHGCTPQEINHFQNVTSLDLKAFPKQHPTMAALLVRIDRAGAISTRHAQVAEQLRLAARVKHGATPPAR